MLCLSLTHPHSLQVTEAGCRLLDAAQAATLNTTAGNDDAVAPLLLSEWRPAQGSRVTVAGGNCTQVSVRFVIYYM